MNIKELSERIGFNIVYIRKCIDKLGEFILPHTKRGDFNQLLFDGNAVAIFDRIKQLKEDGLNFPEIRRRLQADLAQNAESGKTPSEEFEQSGVKLNSEFVKTVLDLSYKISEEKEKRIKEHEEAAKTIRQLQEEKQTLAMQLKLLPEGKTPEQLKADWEDEQKRKREVAKIIGEFKNLGILHFRKRKRLLARLEELNL